LLSYHHSNAQFKMPNDPNVPVIMISAGSGIAPFRHGLLNRWTSHWAIYRGQNYDWVAGTWDPNYTPGVNFLDHDFYNLKNSGQDVSNEGSNFILISIEDAH
jgi:hypothetical protein